VSIDLLLFLLSGSSVVVLLYVIAELWRRRARLLP
jgi:hypothetical protein